MVNEATGLVQFSSLGQATFANNQLTFGDGSVWAKGVSLNPISATPAPSGKSRQESTRNLKFYIIYFNFLKIYLFRDK